LAQVFAVGRQRVRRANAPAPLRSTADTRERTASAAATRPGWRRDGRRNESTPHSAGFYSFGRLSFTVAGFACDASNFCDARAKARRDPSQAVDQMLKGVCVNLW